MPAARWTPCLRAVLAALLPASCALCGGHSEGRAAVCGPCRTDAVRPRRRCPRCANPVNSHGEHGRECGACLARKPAFDATVAAADYAAPLDQLVLQLKFGGQLALAPWFAVLLRDAAIARQPLALPDVLCVVPLSRSRLAERGFNQALEVARPLAQMLGVALDGRLLERVRDTATQSALAPALRANNVRGAFAVKQDAVSGLHVGVVDDVMTSGHTLQAIALALKNAGARQVSNFVVARTPPA
jgi:ComF family protein